MARLHEEGHSEDELPDVSTILVAIKDAQRGVQNDSRSPRKAQRDTGARLTLPLQDKNHLNKPCSILPVRNNVKVSFSDQQARKQKSLRLAHVNSLLLPTLNGLEKSPVKQLTISRQLANGSPLKRTPRRAAAQKLSFTTFVVDPRNTLDSAEEDVSFDDLSEFIVNDSASETELKRPLSVRKHKSRSPTYFQKNREKGKRSDDDKSLSHKPETLPIIIDLISPDRNPSSAGRSKSYQTVPEYSVTTNENSTTDPVSSLRLSPPRSKCPFKVTDREYPVTPPRSPSKPKLQSPSKSKPRVPPSPHRPSLDAFWSQDIINNWNDQYSPQKAPRPRRLFSVDEESEGDISPSNSPRKSPIKSPAKKDREAIERKKVFDGKKHDLALAFLEELDQTTADGRVASLAASTGGIRIIWSKKLNSTAGRANWKREAIKTKNIDGSTSSTSYRHHASIELAEKVIDDEDRLLNVLAHEYCHLANFMISNIRDNPHGKEFKEWAKKVSHAFSHRHISVTTKHTYAITYKYIWACALCGLEFKRHSRSIDTARHTCGSCKGNLLQVQPVPRSGTGKGGEKVVNGYQAYVKKHYGRVKKENSAMGMGEIMGLLGRGYREEKEKRDKEGTGKIGEATEVIELGSIDDGEENSDGGDELDTVARKLDFLSLREEEEN